MKKNPLAILRGGLLGLSMIVPFQDVLGCPISNYFSNWIVTDTDLFTLIAS